MDKVLPILPCSNAEALIDFYSRLGFETVGRFIRSYIIIKYNDIELHFYGAKKIAPQENSSMCFISVDNVDRLYNTFIDNMRASGSKIPRNGFPKITKIRDLSDDRRFTLTDPSGNTFYIGEIKKEKDTNFFRNISNTDYAKKYAVLYDLVYSKEDYSAANNILPKLLDVKDRLHDLDKAKLLLIALEIRSGLAVQYDRTEIDKLVSKYQINNDWKNIKDKLEEILADNID